MWEKLVGQKIVAFRGRLTYFIVYDKHFVPLEAILFDDEETYITFNNQSPYDYHDYCESARIMQVNHDSKEWKEIFNKEGWAEVDFFNF